MDINKGLILFRIIIGVAVIVLGVFVKMDAVDIIDPSKGIMLIVLGAILAAWALLPVLSRKKS